MFGSPETSIYWVEKSVNEDGNPFDFERNNRKSIY